MNTTSQPQRVAILLAKASITGAASREMEELAQHAQTNTRFDQVVHAFSEQGSPSLRTMLDGLSASGCVEEILIVPCMVPMEPGFKTWIAGAVQRWQREWVARGGHAVPQVSIAQAPSQSAAMAGWLQALLEGPASAIAAGQGAIATAGSVIPPQKRRVLVCQGGPCNHAGAALVWGHLRNEQKRLDLRTTGDGMMSARTSCLGPCNLAPVVQVFPEGTWYGGVDEAGVDRIISGHLLQGRPVPELAYAVTPEKQVLRASIPPEGVTDAH
jgi:(2Fe-2S) ferredoxin